LAEYWIHSTGQFGVVYAFGYNSTSGHHNYATITGRRKFTTKMISLQDV